MSEEVQKCSVEGCDNPVEKAPTLRDALNALREYNRFLEDENDGLWEGFQNSYVDDTLLNYYIKYSGLDYSGPAWEQAMKDTIEFHALNHDGEDVSERVEYMDWYHTYRREQGDYDNN